MKLTFLGTGASEGIPAFRCTCRVCSLARDRKGKHIRQNASVFVESESGESVLIDMPAQIKMMLEKYSLSDTGINALLFTHYHIDHTAGIFHLLESMEKNGHVPAGRFLQVYMPVDLYGTIMKSLYTDQPDLGKTDFSSFYSLGILRSLESASCGTLGFTALDTGHLAERPACSAARECHGYLLMEGKKTLAYMVDASPDLPEKSLEMLRRCGAGIGASGGAGGPDCLVFECTFDRYPDSGRGHSDLDGVLRVRDSIRPGRMILTHVSHRNLDHDSLAAYMAGYGIEVAWDGMTIEL